MSSFFLGATIIAMILVAAAMVMGIVSMTKGGDFNRKYGNRLMRARVILQGLALLLFALALMTAE